MNRSCLLIATDSAQSLLSTALAVMKLSYTPYGYSHLADTNGARSGFSGEIAELAGNHYALGLGYRLYNPVLARFHSPDSLSPFDRGGFNAYGYCDGDPVNYSDPNGHMPRAISTGALQGIKKSLANRQAKAKWKTSRWKRESWINRRADRYDKAVDRGADFKAKAVVKKFTKQERHSLSAMESYRTKVRNTFSYQGAHPSAMDAFATVRSDRPGIGLYVEHLQTIEQFYKTKSMYAPTARMRQSANIEFDFAHNNLKAYMHKHRNTDPNTLIRVGDYDKVLEKYKIRDPSRKVRPYDDTYIE